MAHNFEGKDTKVAAKIPDTLVPVRPGDFLLITVPHYWAKGEDIATAKRELEKHYGSLKGRDAPRQWHVYSVHKDSYVSGLGGLCFQTGHDPMLIASTRWPLE